MELLQTIFVFVVVLSILVTVHEFGHFIAARLTGMRVETFAVGMGNRLFGYNKVTGFTFGSLKENDERAAVEAGYTDYRVSMLPIGGYVKISGMIDESMDDSYTKTAPQPHEFRSKNAAQKLLVMTAGVIMNIVLAVLIFAGITFGEGKTVLTTTTVAFVEKNSVFEQAGLRAGDNIVSVNATKVQSWNDLSSLIMAKYIGEDRTLLVERTEQGKTSTVPIVVSDKTITDALAAQHSVMTEIMPVGSAVMITGVESLKPAGKLGLLVGDTLVSINGVPVHSSSQLVETIKANIGKEVALEWKRGGSQMSGLVIPDNDGRIGIGIAPVFRGEMRRQQYGLLESFAIGTQEMIAMCKAQVAAIGQLFKGKASFKQSVGGPIMIAKTSKQAADLGFTALLRFTALLSIVLAIMNILPFPALDGGHVVVILIEAIIRREMPVKVKMAIQQIGVVMLLGFMVFVVYNDLTR